MLQGIHVPSFRAQLSPIEVAHMWADLGVRLQGVGVKSQPQIALKILDLNRNPDSQLKEYARIIRTDPALAGRLLKLANSAFFAQRCAVTSLDRACLLLGVERLKAMSLGFHLSRAAVTDPLAILSRTVWGQSLLRACLATEVARHVAPKLAAEAFVIGLLMDCGIPLMPGLLPSQFLPLWDSSCTPTRLHRAEQESLPFGHTDVAAALASSWKLPDLLLYPIAEHHTPPAFPLRLEPMNQLHAIAYTVGMLDLSPAASTDGSAAVPTPDAPSLKNLQRVLGLDPAAVAGIVGKAALEYEVTTDLFKDVASDVGVDEALLERVQVGMVAALHDLVMESIDRRGAAHDGGVRFHLGGHRVELQRSNDGTVAAYLYDSRGQRLLTHVFQPAGQTSLALREALALEPHPSDEIAAIDLFIRAA